MHLDFFRLYTIKQLPGRDIGLPWSEIIFSTDSCEPVVVRAVAALGCIHQMQTDQSLTTPSGTQRYTDAFTLYHKAVVALQRYIDRAPELGLAVTTETTLLVVLLLFCFEVLCGNDQYATKHLVAAFSILSKHRIQHNLQGQATLVLESKSATPTSVLTQVILRLASDWLVSGESYYGGDDSPLHAVCKDRIPTHFQSELEASVHLDALCSEASRHETLLYQQAFGELDLQVGGDGSGCHQCAKEFLAIAKARCLGLDGRSTTNPSPNDTMMALSRWRSAFTPLNKSKHRSQSVLLLEIQFLQTWFSLITISGPGNVLCDELRDEFELAINIAEESMLGQTPTTRGTQEPDRTLQSLRNLGNNLSSCICLVVEMCRDSKIRRRGIDLLQRVDMRGTFDTAYLVAYYRHLVDAEEMRARAMNFAAPVELRCEDFPLNARFICALMCTCDSETGKSDDDFYRKDYGRMVFVESGSCDGDFQTGESWFQVYRDGQS